MNEKEQKCVEVTSLPHIIATHLYHTQKHTSFMVDLNFIFSRKLINKGKVTSKENKKESNKNQEKREKNKRKERK